MPVAAPIKAGDIAGYLGGVSKKDSKQQIRERSRRKSYRTRQGNTFYKDRRSYEYVKVTITEGPWRREAEDRARRRIETVSGNGEQYAMTEDRNPRGQGS